MSQPVGVVGLGLLGSAIAERLLGGGFRVLVYNRTRSKADPLIRKGAVWSDNPFLQCERVIFSLYNSDVVAAVFDQFDAGLSAGQTVIDTTTGAPQHAETFAGRLAQRDVDYLDAPVSGSSEQARRGEVTMIVGGLRAAYDRCQDLMDCLAQKSLYVGRSGNGSRLKLVSNLVLGLNRAVLAEGLALGSAMGLDDELTLSALKNSAAYSGVMDTKGHKMISGDFRPQARLAQHLKDVRLILEEGSRLDLDLPLSKLHAFLLAELEHLGLGELDNSAIIRAWRDKD
jgi:3-hydroxyisobutyrate dehydrogenase-like beta-hydroxyacid dehydrogenase